MSETIKKQKIKCCNYFKTKLKLSKLSVFSKFWHQDENQPHKFKDTDGLEAYKSQSCCVSTSAYQYHCESVALSLAPPCCIQGYVANKTAVADNKTDKIFNISSKIAAAGADVSYCAFITAAQPPGLHSCGMCAYVRLHPAAGFLLTHDKSCASDNTAPTVHQQGDAHSHLAHQPGVKIHPTTQTTATNCLQVHSIDRRNLTLYIKYNHQLRSDIWTSF